MMHIGRNLRRSFVVSGDINVLLFCVTLALAGERTGPDFPQPSLLSPSTNARVIVSIHAHPQYDVSSRKFFPRRNGALTDSEKPPVTSVCAYLSPSLAFVDGKRLSDRLNGRGNPKPRMGFGLSDGERKTEGPTTKAPKTGCCLVAQCRTAEHCCQRVNVPLAQQTWYSASGLNSRHHPSARDDTCS